MIDNCAPLGYQRLAALGDPAPLTVPKAARAALIQAENQPVRWRDDGTAPTASAGMLLDAGATLFYVGSLGALRFIEAQASATLNVSFYG